MIPLERGHPSTLRQWLVRCWMLGTALAFVLLLAECLRSDAEKETGLVDIGGGLVMRADGTVLDASSLPGAIEANGGWDHEAAEPLTLHALGQPPRWSNRSRSSAARSGLDW